MWVLWQLLNVLLFVVVVGILMLLKHLVVSVVRYQTQKATLARIAPHIPRQKTLFPVFGSFGSDSYSYDSLLDETFDDKGVPLKVLNQGPHLDGSTIIAFSNPDVYKEVLGQPQKYFKTPPSYEPIALFLGKGLVVLEGEEWKKHRKMLTPLFHYGNLKGFIPLMSTIALQMSTEMAKSSQTCSAKFIKNWAMKINIAAIFGDSFDCNYLADQFGSFVAIMADWFTAYFIFGNFVVHLPLPSEIQRKKVTAAIKNKILEDLEERKKLGKEKTGADLISLLLRSEVPNDFIIDEAITFLFAGFDTTSTLMQWSLYFLTKYPDTQAKLFAEYTEVLGTKTEITDETLTKLVYHKAFLQESLRLRPPVPALDRMCNETVTLDGETIPPHTAITLNFHTTHLDPRLWENPREFRPERFLEKDYLKHPYAFVPFSAGERNCIGQKVAMQEAIILLATIVRDFTVKSDNVNSVIMKVELMLAPMGLNVQFSPRK